MRKPLEGVRVVELGTYVAAPRTARILGDWGASVIKVESLQGDVWRYLAKSFGLPIDPDHAPLFEPDNMNKRDITLDLKSEKGQEVLHKLLAEADVFVTSTRLDGLKRMGIDYENLRVKHPRLIVAQICGFGNQGPLSKNPGFDSACYWGGAGIAQTWAYEGQTPVSPVLASETPLQLLFWWPLFWLLFTTGNSLAKVSTSKILCMVVASGITPTA